MGRIHKGTFFSSIFYFFLGEYFSDALRNTLTIILPILVFYFTGQPQLGIGIGVGALLVSLTDFPDNKLNKFKTAAYGLVIFFLTTIVMAAALNSFILTAVVMILAAFCFSMCAVYGNRMAMIGTMAIVVCTFVMGMQPKHPFIFSLYMLIGGIWYYLNSLIQIWIFPYRSLHHAVFECLMSSAQFLKAKAKNYDPNQVFDPSQKEVIRLHTKVNAKHETIRNLMLTDKLAMHPGNKNGRLLLGRTFLLIDLYELLNAVHYNYLSLRESFSGEKSLHAMKAVIDFLAKELESLAGNMRLGRFSAKPDLSENRDEYIYKQIFIEDNGLNADQQNILKAFNDNTLAVGKILSMLRRNESPQRSIAQDNGHDFDYKLFLTGKTTPIWHSLSLSSPIFRFSLRLALCFLFGFIIISQMTLSRYSYWLFLTIVIVARPKFTITWKRNLQRISGSMAGIIIGFAIVYFVQKPVILLCAAVFCLLGFFSFNRLSYALSVIFITLSVILTLSIYHGHFDLIIQNRILYTIMGCLIAVLASYLFPIWDSRQLEEKINSARKASAKYLGELSANKAVQHSSAIRLVRKDANLSLSNLSEALESAAQEPFNKKIGLERFYNKQVILYKINALLTSIYLSGEALEEGLSAEIISNLTKSGLIVNESTPERLKLDTSGDKLQQIFQLSQAFAGVPEG